MNDLDKGVDFTSHFSKQKPVKRCREDHSRSQAITSTGHPTRRKHVGKGKQPASLTPKEASKAPKREAYSVCIDEHSLHKKKLKASTEDGHSAQHSGRSQAKLHASKDLWPFEVDYNDHFETPLQAVQDIEPVLRILSKKLKTPKPNLAIYDPFFCQGGIRRHYEHLGFINLIHRNRDFYQDLESGNMPSYDILVTNPPYSADHKERILEFCLRSGKPWALLLPNYVATKAYFGQLLDSTSTPASQRPFFLTPQARYSYEHPEGTGHAESPFFSIWYVGLGEHTEAIYGACKARLASQAGAATAASKRKGDSAGNADGGMWRVSLARNVDALKHAGAVPTARRLNPKQRARLKQQKLKAVQ